MTPGFQRRDGRCSKVDRRIVPYQSRHDDLVEIGVRLKADHGYEASWVRRLAASFW